MDFFMQNQWRFPEKNIYAKKTIVCENKKCKDSVIIEVVNDKAYLRQDVYYRTLRISKKHKKFLTYCETCYKK